MFISRLTAEILSAAIDGYEAQKSRIDAKIAELRAMLPDGSPESAATPAQPAKRKRRLSAAGRRAIADAARRRWAQARAEAAKAATAKKATRARKKTAVKKAAPVKKPVVAKKTAPAAARAAMEVAPH